MKYIALLLLLVTNVYAENVVYTFGVNLALDGEPSQTTSAQIDSLRGYEVWRDWWNALPPSVRTTSWGDTFEVALHIERFSSYGYEEWMHQSLYDRYTTMKMNDSIDYFFGPTAWAGVALRQYAYETLGIEVMMCPTDSSEAYYSIPGSFGTATANVFTMTSWLPYLRIEKAKTISIIQVNDGVYQSEMCSGVAEMATLNGLDVLNYFEDMPFDWWTLGSIEGMEGRASVWLSALDEVRRSNPDAVIICDYNHGAEFSLRYMRDNDWMPKMVGVSPLSGDVFDDASLLDYVIVPSQYDIHALYSSQVNFTDSSGYDQLIMERYGVPASSIMAESTLAGMLFSYAIARSPDNSSESIADTIRRSQLQSFMGTTSFDVNGRQTMPSLMLQLIESNSKSHVVGPPLAATENLIYPMPTWKERVFNPKWGSHVEVAATTLMVVGIVCNVVFAALLIANWNEQIMRSASPTFCAAIIVGGIVAYGSIPTWMPNLVNNTSCSFRAVVLPVGFMMLFGSLIAKSDRVHRIFTLDTVDIIRISDLQVMCIVVAILLIQAIFSTTIALISSGNAKIVVIDAYRVSLNYYTCGIGASSAFRVMLGINIAYFVILLTWGTYLAYHIRLIPYAMYNESKTIIFSIYNAAIFCTIAVVIQLAVGNSNRDLTFMITTACIFLGVMGSTCALFVPKFKSIYFPSDHSSSRGSSYTSSQNTQLEALKQENKKLKAELGKLTASKE